MQSDRELLSRHQLLDRPPASGTEARALLGMVEEVADRTPHGGRVFGGDIEAVRLQIEAARPRESAQQTLRSQPRMRPACARATILYDVGLSCAMGHDYRFSHRHGLENRGYPGLKINVCQRHNNNGRTRVKIAESNIVE